VTRFTKVAKFICQLFEKQKSQALVKQVYDQFEDGTCHRQGLCSSKSFEFTYLFFCLSVNLRALVALPKLLPPHLSTRTTHEDIVNHIKSFKHLLDKVPSSALLQIAPVSMGRV